jgi:hypothetical protein
MERGNPGRPAKAGWQEPADSLEQFLLREGLLDEADAARAESPLYCLRSDESRHEQDRLIGTPFPKRDGELRGRVLQGRRDGVTPQERLSTDGRPRQTTE